MHIPPLVLLDLAASFMLAAAASCRAMSGGAHFSGAATAAILSGLAAPLVRELLAGFGSAVLRNSLYLAVVVLGALAGALAARLRGSRRWFYWFDAAGLGLGAGIAAVSGSLLGLPVVGCLVLSVVSAVAGGFVRDMALGDMSMAVEEELYATAAALGAMLTFALRVYAPLADWQCALWGAALVVLLRVLRLRKKNAPEFL